jgi:hypothetical protein
MARLGRAIYPYQTVTATLQLAGKASRSAVRLEAMPTLAQQIHIAAESADLRRATTSMRPGTALPDELGYDTGRLLSGCAWNVDEDIIELTIELVGLLQDELAI